MFLINIECVVAVTNNPYLIKYCLKCAILMVCLIEFKKKRMSFTRVAFGSVVNSVRCSIVWNERVGTTMQNELKINGN